MKEFNPPGLRHYLDAEAAAGEHQDNPYNGHPVAAASRIEPLRSIERSVSVAFDNRADKRTVEAAFLNVRDSLDAIRLAYRAAVHMATEAFVGIRGPAARPPEWLEDHVDAAEPLAEPSMIRDVPEGGTANQGDPPPGTDRVPDPIFFQDENPHPPQDPSPGQLLDPSVDPRNQPLAPNRPPETSGDPDHLPGPRAVADQSEERNAESSRRIADNRKEARAARRNRPPAAVVPPGSSPAAPPEQQLAPAIPPPPTTGPGDLPPLTNPPAPVFGDTTPPPEETGPPGEGNATDADRPGGDSEVGREDRGAAPGGIPPAPLPG